MVGWGEAREKRWRNEAAKSGCKAAIYKDHPLACLLIPSHDRHKRFLGHLHLSDMLHPLLALRLTLEELFLPRLVATAHGFPALTPR